MSEEEIDSALRGYAHARSESDALAKTLPPEKYAEAMHAELDRLIESIVHPERKPH